MATSYTKAQLTMYLTERNAEVKALHEKLGHLELECATLRSQLKAPKRQARSPEDREAFLAEAERRSELGARCAALSRKYNAVGRVRDGVIELYSRRRGAWIAAPSDM